MVTTEHTTLKHTQENDLQWFAMRVLYRGEQAMEELLQAEGMETFLPLRMVEKVVGGRKKRVQVPVISNLLFVHAVKCQLQAFKDASGRGRLQYLCHRGGPLDRRPIIVPDNQMEAFIRIYRAGNHEMTTDLAEFKPGTKVRVVEGPFAGLTGTFQSVKGHRGRRFVVQIQGLAAISTIISPSCLEVVKE